MTCRCCRFPVPLDAYRRQLDRLVRIGLPKEYADKLMPLCRKCVDIYLDPAIIMEDERHD
jgi:hypothetical protein